jgi:hypothetical protein
MLAHNQMMPIRLFLSCSKDVAEVAALDPGNHDGDEHTREAGTSVDYAEDNGQGVVTGRRIGRQRGGRELSWCRGCCRDCKCWGQHDS